jgi:hypothetical protein
VFSSFVEEIVIE